MHCHASLHPLVEITYIMAVLSLKNSYDGRVMDTHTANICKMSVGHLNLNQVIFKVNHELLAAFLDRIGAVQLDMFASFHRLVS